MNSAGENTVNKNKLAGYPQTLAEEINRICTQIKKAQNEITPVICNCSYTVALQRRNNKTSIQIVMMSFIMELSAQRIPPPALLERI